MFRVCLSPKRKELCLPGLSLHLWKTEGTTSLSLSNINYIIRVRKCCSNLPSGYYYFYVSSMLLSLSTLFFNHFLCTVSWVTQFPVRRIKGLESRFKINKQTNYPQWVAPCRACPNMNFSSDCDCQFQMSIIVWIRIVCVTLRAQSNKSVQCTKILYWDRLVQMRNAIFP